MIVVTGAAGFIGSNIVAALNDSDRSDVVICDWLASDLRWMNLRKRFFRNFVFPPDLLRYLNESRGIECVIHLGANSSTVATDGDEIIRTNFQFSLQLLDWCTQTATPFIYASSAATYGSGEHGFEDRSNFNALRELRPLNLYGWSKHQFDLVVSERKSKELPLPPKCIGLKFFNVYGQNEYHKGEMRSLLAKNFNAIREGREVNLFKSYRSEFCDGGQKRDFVYIDDVVDVVAWCMQAEVDYGIFNVGTGRATTFLEFVSAMFESLEQTPRISFIDMPQSLRDRYQYFTEASLLGLRRAGYDGQFADIKRGTNAYMRYLLSSDKYR